MSLKQSADSKNDSAQPVYTAEKVIQQETPKILIQRVFQQTENQTVEKKLDFVIANSETEITKHVFGGLFNSKYYPYIPENYCKKHAPDLFEYENEELPKIGDKFDSHNSFRLYVDGKAKEWKYYLKCADSHRKKGKDTFVYKCVFAKPRSAVSKAKGLRKRTRRVPLHNCPCRVLLKPVPSGAKDLTVIYVCNHHDHPLTDDYFYKLQHGRRLHPSVKEELMDLLALDVDKEIVKKYVESETGCSMSYGYFANIVTYMKKNKIERQIPMLKLKELSKKIDRIKEELGITKECENEDDPDDDFSQSPTVSKNMPSKIAEVFNVLNSVTAPKKISKRNRNHLEEVEALDREPKSTKSRKQSEDITKIADITLTNKSRLETRLQQLTYDQETLENIKHLQEAVRTEKNPWIDDHDVNSKRTTESDTLNNHIQKSPDKNSMADVYSDQEVIEESVVQTYEKGIDISEYDNDIFCEYEVTTEENNTENEMEHITCKINDSIDLLNLENGGEVSYCIQYENTDNTSDILDGSYIVLDNLENLPLKVQATELATVRITPEVYEDKNKYSDIDNQVSFHTEDEVVEEHKIENLVELVEQPLADVSLNSGKRDIYEVIETNNKKILPNREVVHTVILNKPNITKSRFMVKSRNNEYKVAKKRTLKYMTHQFDDVKLETEQLLGQLRTHYGVDLNQLKDDDYYVLVVDNTKKRR